MFSFRIGVVLTGWLGFVVSLVGVFLVIDCDGGTVVIHAVAGEERSECEYQGFWSS